MPVQASVTVNRLVRYDELPGTLRRLGFDNVAFSYPRREPLGSSSLVYGASDLVDLDRDELLAALDAIGRLRKQFSVLNPRASLFRRGVAQSLWALAEELPNMRRLARRRKQATAALSLAGWSSNEPTEA